MVVSSCRFAKAQYEGKLVKAMAVTSDKRAPSMPDVPTLRGDLGVKHADVSLEFCGGVCSYRRHAGADPGQTRKGHQGHHGESGRARTARQSRYDPSSPRPALKVKLENEIKNWSKFIDAKGIKVEQ